jgi:PhzF family phenazine biosynthesis protein
MAGMRLSTVDVFAATPFRGNPVTVVHDAEALTAEEMQAFAHWTNLSETTFLLPPTDPGADYRLRIFTPASELSFAGHPTLGSARAWLAAGGVPARDGEVMQECGVGLVRIRATDGTLAFAAPPLVRSGPVTADLLARIVAVLGIDPSDVEAAAWIDNGPGWVGLVLPSAEAVLALDPDFHAMVGLDVGVIGAHPDGGPADFEVRAFCPGYGIPEDPVTGSLNAGLGQWLTGSGLAGPSYTVRQGTAIGRNGLVHIERHDGDVWVSGSADIRVSGQVDVG